MALEIGLNWLWLLGGFGALIALLLFELRRADSVSIRSCLRRGVALAMVALALFPTISASDDLIRIGHLDVGLLTRGEASLSAAQPSSTKTAAALYLARLFEALEKVQISRAYRLFVTPQYFALSPVNLRACRDRALPSAVGRAPPAQPLASL